MPPSPQVGARTCDLKEWDATVTQDEIFSLDDLDEFINTDFTSIFRDIVHQEQHTYPRLLQQYPVAKKREQGADSASEPLLKRRRLEPRSLYGFIPKVILLFNYLSYALFGQLKFFLNLNAASCIPIAFFSFVMSS